MSALVCAASVWAQTPVAPGGPSVQSESASESGVRDVLEAFLEDRGLDGLLADHLRLKLVTAVGDERVAIADRLGRLYVKLLGEAKSAEARGVWEARSRDLLRLVPEADSFDLRISLAKVPYLRAEEIAERERLRLASPAEVEEAIRSLRVVQSSLSELGSKVHRKVEGLERQEARGGEGGDSAKLQRELGEARRLRSLAMYYAGWSNYYLAMLTKDQRLAADAQRDFGWLLNAVPGRAASLERFSPSMLRFEHVARAAVGCALAASMRGSDVEALRWLDAVAVAADVPESVSGQLFVRRMVVLADAARWSDAELMVKRRRASGEKLSVGEARLSVVRAMEALREQQMRPIERETAARVAQAGLSDLISQGEVGHVQDLVSRYGTALIGEEGFIVQYVRGLQAFERARSAHAEAAPEKAEEPTADEAVVNRYREAAESLKLAVGSADAEKFAKERIAAGLTLGLSLYYAGLFEAAADRFEAVHAEAGATAQGEEALWMAVVTLDKAVEGARPSLAPRRDRVAGVYLASFPRGERAARLLLRKATAGLVGDEEAVRTLLEVPESSPLRQTARAQAAELLYGLYRRSAAKDRDFAALRFIDVAEPAMSGLAKVAVSGRAESAAAALTTVRLGRQILDAALGASSADVERAERALAVIDEVSVRAGLDLGAAEDELEFRRLQVASARGETARVEALAERLRGRGSENRFARAADQLLFQRAASAWREVPGDVERARAVVRTGGRVMAALGSDARALASDSTYTVHTTVASAAEAVWRGAQDTGARDLALRVDRTLRDSGRQTAEVLTRLARLAEEAGEQVEALEAWRTLMAGLSPESAAWYEARYESLRILATLDVARAREAIGQHRMLQPGYGPEPWGSKLRELDERLWGVVKGGER